MVQTLYPGQDFTGSVRIKGVDAQFWLKSSMLRLGRRGIRLFEGIEEVYRENSI